MPSNTAKATILPFVEKITVSDRMRTVKTFTKCVFSQAPAAPLQHYCIDFTGKKTYG